MKLLCPRVITGSLNSLNKGAVDWGFQGLLAYGSENVVVVVEPKIVQVIQALEKHRSPVVKVKWARENYCHDIASPYTLRLASADTSGHILVWDVAAATTRASFSDGGRPIQDMEWLSQQDTSHDLLAVLHPPYSLVLWNADTGTKIWKKTYTEPLLSVSFDPFDAANVAFLGQDCILLVEDFSCHKVPSSNGRKFYISNSNAGVSGSASTGSLGSHGNGSAGGTSALVSAAERRAGARQMIRNKVKMLVMQEGKHSKIEDAGAVMLTDCLQLAYHPAWRHCLLLVYPREVLLVDLHVKQTVGIIPMERTGSPFVQVFPCRQRDVLVCLHENGAITVRVRKIFASPAPTPNEPGSPYMQIGESNVDVVYELRCQSDPMRLSKQSRVFSVSACPISENKFALLLGDGRLLLWELKTVEHAFAPHVYNQLPMSPLHTPGHRGPVDSATYPADWTFPYKCNVAGPQATIADMIAPSNNTAVEGSTGSRHDVCFKFLLVGMLSGAASPVTVLRMCPPLTTKNWNVYKPLLAAGTMCGSVQVFNLSTGTLWKEFSIHTCAIRGIEWVSLTGFLSYAYPTPGGNSGLIKNELLLVDINTGRTRLLRGDKGVDESPMELVRVSYLKQYVCVVFKDNPMELWDLRSFTLLRQMPRSFPVITALEWSPSASVKNLKRRHESQESADSVGREQTTEQGSPASAMDAANRQEGKPPGAAKEHFVFTDNDGQLYHFVVEGSMVKEGSKIPADASMGSITCIAWKGDMMVLADVDGNLSIWDLKNRISRAIPTDRGWIKKVRFAPGRGNMKLVILYNDGVDVWDAKDVELVSSIKTPKDLPKLHDIEWAASDRPMLSSEDGCIRVLDLLMRSSCSPIQHHDTVEPIFSPYLLPGRASLSLQYHLQHQPWRDEYSLTMTDLVDTAEEFTQRLVNEQVDVLDRDVRSYLPSCRFGVAERCLTVGRLFGDESEIYFWTVALYYLRAEKARPMSKSDSFAKRQQGHGDVFVPRGGTTVHEVQDLVELDNKQRSEAEETDKLWEALRGPALDRCWDILTDGATFQKNNHEQLALHESKRTSYELTQQCVEEMVLLGQGDRAVHMLLETDADSEAYYADCLRACLVATIRSSGASQSTIKLVATNLIANGKLSEGIQLLCLIDKGMDACRYLQSYGKWNMAAWLAKSTLDYSECLEVFKRWVEHLCIPTVNLKSKAVLILLSLGQFNKVIEMLYSMRQFRRAALFIEACLEFEVLNISSDNDALIEAVYLEYGRYLSNLGNKTAAVHYCGKAGDKGQQLRKELDILFEQ
ncbi:PREDICTED: WD repeat-containing protein 11-like [Priapulus caudatus]|uniref:WD repeat-containing protein 11-like n=1 Tax=Priapulus caudatus TaxID=37621 RepID=A0ABM1ES66_PRICU|nr:PREDICTED: WD repeat-containing protein 11-like [Priapulus caudatus]